jgi:NADH dehydrogenase FAD-containing subunit
MWIQINLPEMRDHIIMESEKYGSPLMRKFLHNWNVQVFTAEHVEAVLSNTVNITKSFNYSFAEPWFGQGLLTR